MRCVKETVLEQGICIMTDGGDEPVPVPTPAAESMVRNGSK